MASFMRSAFIGGFLAVAGCGASGSDVPVAQLGKTESSIRAAAEVGADSTPEAALHLKLARDAMRRAQALTRKEEYDAARNLLDEAEADAQLALMLTRERQASASASQARQQAESIH